MRDLMMQECTLMATFDHPNVLTLIGVCVDGGPSPFIVMPFMFNGSLLAHLKKERENLVIPPDQQMDSDILLAIYNLHMRCITTAFTQFSDWCINEADGHVFADNQRNGVLGQ